MWIRPRRKLIEAAIKLAVSSQKGHKIVIIDYEQPLHSISIDAASLVIRKVQLTRQHYHENRTRYDLRELVRKTIHTTGFDSGRRYAYELVAMRYYNLLSQYAAHLRRNRKLPRIARVRFQPIAPIPLALTG